MKITKQMIDYIRLQRTSIQDKFTQRYENSLQEDFNIIKLYLPEKCNKILDIGCGLAGIDLFLYNYYKNVELHLFDYNTTSEKVYYGYQKEAAHYNSLTLAGEFLKINGVNKKQIGLHEVEKGFPEKNYDLIISLISYGFHYPISTYFTSIKKYKGVPKIFDIRKNTDQIEFLTSNYNYVLIIHNFEKYQRVLVK